jgi:coronin-1B/1C/6
MVLFFKIDSTVRLWEIPQGGLNHDINTENQKFTGHSKKVGMINFHPTVADIIASAGFDNTVNVWNFVNGNSYSKININDNPLCLEWNENGSLLGITTKEKMIHLLDPRGNKIEMSTKGCESNKTQKMGFLGDTDYIYNTGVSKANERQIKLFDMRNFNEAIAVVPVDSQTGIMMPHYDADTGLLYVPGRGEGNIKYFDFSAGSLKFANEYRSNVQQKGIASFAKRTMNYNKCEIARFAKLSINAVEYLSFYFPKRVTCINIE